MSENRQIATCFCSGVRRRYLTDTIFCFTADNVEVFHVVQDDFFQHMRAAGYTDVERGERARREEHLTVPQFKVI